MGTSTDTMMTLNDTSSDKWILILSEDLKLVGNKVNDFDLPGINADGTIGPRGGGNTMLNIPGDTLTFDPITFTFKVDEDYTNYIQALKYLIDNVKSYDPFREVVVMLLDNMNQPSGTEFRYSGSRASNLGGISLDVNATIRTLSCTITIMFQEFEISKNGVVVVSSN